MMVKRLLLIVIACLSVSALSLAQSTNWKYYRHEISFGVGASNFLGELGGADQIGTDGLKDLEFSMTRPTIAAGYRYKISPFFAARANLIYSRLNGDDATTNELFRQNRNLHFRTPLVEFSAQFEWYPLQERSGHLYRFKGVRGQKGTSWSPYLFAGIGGFWFNPKAQDQNGNWTALQPLGTEGQTAGNGSKYSRIAMTVPMGIGVKYSLDKQWSIGFEVSGRMTFTDYVDDVSTEYYDEALIRAANPGSEDAAAYLADPSLGLEGQLSGIQSITPGQTRGDPTDNDAYMFAILSINYKLLKGRFNLPKF